MRFVLKIFLWSLSRSIFAAPKSCTPTPPKRSRWSKSKSAIHQNSVTGNSVPRNGDNSGDSGSPSLYTSQIIWEEEQEEDENNGKNKGSVDRSKKKRALISWSRVWGNPYHEQGQLTRRPNPTESDTSDIHPLRTDIWKLQISWRGKERNRRKHKEGRVESLLMEFSDSGFVRLQPPRANNASDHRALVAGFPFGTWKLDQFSLLLSWKLALAEGGDEAHEQEQYSFHANLHLNPFGDEPALTSGLILGEGIGPDGRWFRPVVGTFTGIGTGKDKADLSYKHRRLGTY